MILVVGNAHDHTSNSSRLIVVWDDDYDFNASSTKLNELSCHINQDRLA
jgi:hypothetical protein